MAKPPQQPSSSVPGLSEPGSISQADRNGNPNELKAFNLSDRALLSPKTCRPKVTEQEDILLKTERMGQRLPPLQPLVFLPDTPSWDL